MVRCAVSTKLSTTAPSTARARPHAARGSGPRGRRSARRRRGEIRRLVEQGAVASRTWSAPTTTRPGRRAATAPALASARGRARASGGRPAQSASTARSSTPGLSVSTQGPRSRGARAAWHWWRRGGGAGPRARASGPPAGGGAHEAMNFRRCSRCRSRMAAAVSSIERRVTSMVGQRCLAQSRRQAAISSATRARSYVERESSAFRLRSRFWRIWTMRSGLARSPTRSGFRAVSRLSGRGMPVPAGSSRSSGRDWRGRSPSGSSRCG